MLVGAHVSPAGGLPNAHERGAQRGCDAIQVFHQSPRAWRPTNHKPPDIERFVELLAGAAPNVVVIHAVYLINAASKDPEIRAKSAASLTHALQLGDAIGAAGVVLHPGSTVGEPLQESLDRIGEVLLVALGHSERCPLLLENTAGAGNTIGRSFEELYAVLERVEGDERVGLCLDSCHMFASGFDIRTAAGLGAVIDDCGATVGAGRIRCLHVNDSLTDLGSNRDRHAAVGDGLIGREGCAAFLSEPRFEGLPAIFEGPGLDGKAPSGRDTERMRELRAEGLAARAG